jgi:hypothetical protein
MCTPCAALVYAKKCICLYRLIHIGQWNTEPCSSKLPSSSTDIDVSKQHFCRNRNLAEDVSFNLSSCDAADCVRSDPTRHRYPVSIISDHVKVVCVYCLLELEHLDHGFEYHWGHSCMSPLYLHLHCPVYVEALRLADPNPRCPM